jgi:hypothetical protein
VLPKQGVAAPWVLRQNYSIDLLSTRLGDVTRDMVFTASPMSELASESMSQRLREALAERSEVER